MNTPVWQPGEARCWILAYDIADPRRLARLYRLAARGARRLQYSVYLYTGSEPAMRAWLARLLVILDPCHDDFRLYPLPRQPRLWQYGAASLPEGVLCFDAPAIM